MIEELLPTLKQVAYKRMETSLTDFENEDLIYKGIMDSVTELRDKYEELALQSEHKGVIDKLLDELDKLELEQAKIAYLVGVTDGMLILDKLDLLKE